VRLCIQGTVFSPRIKKWRAAQSLQYVTDYVAGGQVGYLQQGSHSWSDWELADPANRGEAIADAVKTIREIAFPYFAQFQDLESLIPFLVENEMPSMSIERVVEFLMCFADKPTARMAAVQFFQRRPDLVPDYRIEFQRYADLATRDTVPSGYAQQMALASHLFDFGDVT
jgi:hypothetical protein